MNNKFLYVGVLIVIIGGVYTFIYAETQGYGYVLGSKVPMTESGANLIGSQYFEETTYPKEGFLIIGAGVVVAFYGLISSEKRLSN